MAATVISPIVDGAYQSGCHTASVWDNKSKANIPRLMKFMNDFGLISTRPKRGIPSNDRCNSKYLMILLLMNGRSLLVVTLTQECQRELLLVLIRNCSTCIGYSGFNANSRISKVTFKGDMKTYMDFRDVVHATQSQMLKQFGGEMYSKVEY
jgi:aconitate hydratase 2/2-methylisocitrate dehydratase